MTSRFSSRSLPVWVAPVLIFVLALALRCFALNYHSLWFDEVMSTFWASQPVGEVWRVGLSLTQDKHPPLYYLLLHAWTALAGPGDVSVRALGAWLGALAVFPAWGIGRRVGSGRSAAIGAVLVALNPFLIWYSQEARMFMPATTFILVGLYGTTRLADAGGPKVESSRGGSVPWLATLLMLAGFVAALYSYLFSALALPVALAWVVLLAWRAWRVGNGRRVAVWGIAALTVTGLCFLPLARSAWQVSGAESAPGHAFSGMVAPLWRLLEVYTLGWPAWRPTLLSAAALVAAVLAVLGLVVSSEARPRFAVARSIGGALLGLWLVVPLLAGSLLLARDRTVFAETRYFIFLVPTLCLAWGRALGWLTERRPAVGWPVMALVLSATLIALPALWSPENRKEAWREAAAFVASQAGPNDAVLIQADYVAPAFQRYFSGPQPVFTPFTDTIADGTQVEAPLAGLEGFDAVWLVQSHHETLDPGSQVSGWFAARFPLITEVFPPGIAVRGYLQHPLMDALPAGVVPLTPTIAKDTSPQLIACTYRPQQLTATDDLFHPPSNWVHATTYWMSGESPPAHALPVVQMTDAAGQVWGQSLERPGSTFERWPPVSWQPGDIVRADHDINLNPATPPGIYRLVVGSPGASGPAASCGEVEIVP
jgi:4-amino-4-deoxy-L-arabinose transferase-like glycosyltransferase